eukprot:884128-Prymnesium_polylepis.1
MHPCAAPHHTGRTCDDCVPPALSVPPTLLPPSADCKDKPKFGGSNKRRQACRTKFDQLKALQLPRTKTLDHETVPFTHGTLLLEVPFEELLSPLPTTQLIDYNHA